MLKESLQSAGKVIHLFTRSVRMSRTHPFAHVFSGQERGGLGRSGYDTVGECIEKHEKCPSHHMGR